MQPTRRTILTATGALLVAAAATPIAARADTPAAPSDKNLADPHMDDRALGSPDAKVTAEEWFSFTCPHCARFQADVFPLVQAQLIDTGKLRYVFHEYPRDQVDLTAAMVARSLPPSRYVPFVETLLASQPRWAFDRSVDPKEEIAKMAALAGMPREMFDHVLADESLKAAILGAQSKAEAAYSIDSTPTFIINGHVHSGEADIDTFKKWVGA